MTRSSGRLLERNAISLLLTVILVSILPYTPGLVYCESSSIPYYADVIKYPTPGLPEPVLDGGVFNVTVKIDSNVVWLDAVVYSEVTRVTATLLNAEYDDVKGLWNLQYKLPSGLGEGAYNLNITYKSSTNGSAEVLTQPRSLWILPSWPETLEILVCGDVKVNGIPYWRELVREANLIDPDLIIFLGDLVNIPTIRSEWIKFLEPFNLILDPIYMIPGNHEYSSIGNAEFYERIIGPVNYSVVIGDFLLIGLDTDLDGWIRMDRLKWIEKILMKYRDKTKIIFFHHPLFDPKIKSLESGYFNISSWTDFDYFIENGLIYSEEGSWISHLNEARELFRLIIEYDVRLILSEHIHTDLNVIIENTNTGKKHYFISPAALAYDIPDYDLRGFKLIKISANGTVDETSLYYPGTGIFTYPNSIPIDIGCTVNYQPKQPYEIGFLEYYYTPRNNGTSHAVSFIVKNKLNMTFSNPRIVFRLPADIPIENYEWHPYTPEYEYIEKDGIYYVFLKNIQIPANDIIYFTVEAEDDTDKPTVNIIDAPEKVNPGSWIKVKIEAFDEGWGIKDVGIMYSVTEGKWVVPLSPFIDFIKLSNGRVVYEAWIQAPKTDTILKITAFAVDCSEKTSDYATVEIIVGTPPKPKHTLTIESSPISNIELTINGSSYTTPFSEQLEEGHYSISVPKKITVEGETYNFDKWSDGNTNPTRTIYLNEDMSLTINYEKEVPPPPPPSFTQWLPMITAVIIVVIIVILYLARLRKSST